MKKIVLLFTFLGTICLSFVRQDIKVFSKSLNKSVNVTIVMPDTYSKNNKYPSIYVLHGYSGNNANFVTKTPIGYLSDKYNVVFISPDGGYDSWYIKYEKFIAKELTKTIESEYSVETKKEKRAITGLSMGGFGALYIGINNQDIFGNIGSMSGGVDIEGYKYNWNIQGIKGDLKKYNIEEIAHKLIGTKSNIIFDCGYNDFFILPNRKLHQKLLDLNISHMYSERKGEHNWIYWSDSIKYQTVFFVNMFNNGCVKR